MKEFLMIFSIRSGCWYVAEVCQKWAFQVGEGSFIRVFLNLEFAGQNERVSLLSHSKQYLNKRGHADPGNYLLLLLKKMRGRRKRLGVRSASGFGCSTLQPRVATHLLNNTSDDKSHSSAHSPFISLHIWQQDCKSWLVINN